ncbi:GtrA family protein [Prochlorococcus marinus]|uniref:GtrA family protein n=1 Tax=Prochlorococcus marinus TaxID=1219 RepID=UPI000311953A
MLNNLQINKQKRLFLVFGFLNFLITNAVLQISLFFTPILFSTILSQIINFIIGYYLYGKKVFKLNKLTNLVFRKYFALAFILWILNFVFIRLLFYFGVNKNISALVVIPLLVLISYFFQKRYVFK